MSFHLTTNGWSARYLSPHFVLRNYFHCAITHKAFDFDCLFQEWTNGRLIPSYFFPVIRHLKQIQQPVKWRVFLDLVGYLVNSQWQATEKPYISYHVLFDVQPCKVCSIWLYFWFYQLYHYVVPTN